MNYPYRVPPGPETVFFQNFGYRFSDNELLFMRHAPYRFVEQGNALWFDHHAFQGANISAEAGLQLVVRVNRPRAEFEFLEPMVIELQVKKGPAERRPAPEHLLRHGDRPPVAVKRDGAEAPQYPRYP